MTIHDFPLLLAVAAGAVQPGRTTLVGAGARKHRLRALPPKRTLLATRLNVTRDLSRVLNSSTATDDGNDDVRHAQTPQSIECIRETGQGACMSSHSCYSHPHEAPRGPTTCELGTCVCEPGHCAGSDGVCYPSKNILVSKGFSLISALWPEYFLSVSANGIALTQDPYEAQLSLHEFPKEMSGPKVYMLASLDGTYVAACQKFKKGDDARCRPSAAYANGRGDAEHLAVRFATAPPYEGAPYGAQSLTIEWVTKPGDLLVAPHFSSTVNTDSNGPGVSSFWVASAKLPLDVPPYVGPPCVVDCGHWGSGTEWGYRKWMKFLSYFLFWSVIICCVALFLLLRKEEIEEHRTQR